MIDKALYQREWRKRNPGYASSYSKGYHMRRYRPDGHMPRSLILQIRLECLRLGGDPGFTKDIQLAICSLWEWTEEGSDEWCWLHPEECVSTSNSLATGWRILKPASRERIRSRVD